MKDIAIISIPRYNELLEIEKIYQSIDKKQVLIDYSNFTGRRYVILINPDEATKELSNEIDKLKTAFDTLRNSKIYTMFGRKRIADLKLIP